MKNALTATITTTPDEDFDWDEAEDAFAPEVTPAAADAPRAPKVAWNRLNADHIGYEALHQVLRATRGSASDHACADCAQPAAEWSLFDHQSPFNVVGKNHGRPATFSLDMFDYQPRCKPCHRTHDARMRHRHAVLTSKVTAQIVGQGSLKFAASKLSQGIR